MHNSPTATATAQLKKPNQDNQFLRSFERKEALLKSMMQKVNQLQVDMNMHALTFSLW